ncbi:MAG: sensor domain-containing diguanylate cyclase [Candidatus Omnitrophota bacterium]|nr:MAG: sensor domain-containing diguanylate cyclase [Candidatus Omnitrophota bacterium]
MHQLILLVSVSFIYTISLLIATQIKDYYFVFNLCIIPIVISGYFFKAFSTLLLTSFCCVLGLTLMHGGASAAEVAQSISLFIGSALLSIGMYRIFDKLKNYKQDNIGLLKEKFAKSSSTTAQVNDSRAYLENKASEMSNLYYSVKRMGSCFAFDNLLNILRDTITESFKFKRCELIILYHSDETVKIDKIYQITKTKMEQIEGIGYGEGLLKFMLRKKQLLQIDIKKGKIDAEEFMPPEELNTFIAAPIISGEKTNAILAAEDIDLEQRDRFTVVANQFSMALERIRLYELVQELAITDGLTGVFVRRHMLERLNEELNRADRFNSRVSLLMIDIDNFKNYNDRYGHLKGDLLLKKIASVLKGGIREIDIIARYGGEEFCIIFPDTDTKGAELVASRLRESVENLEATVSIGVASYPEDAKTWSNLIEKADRMIYKAKGAGKNRVCVYAK